MSTMDRRDLLALLAAGSVTALVPLPPSVRERAARHVAQALAGSPYQPAFFTASEWEAVRVLSDLVIPRDDHSGSATDAGVPEFIDFVMTDKPDEQTPMRGGLAWLERECLHRFGKRFVACTSQERNGLLDDIAWPARARPHMAPGVTFFNQFRDLVCSGFYSSKEGVKDLQYQGNTFVTEWTGCPPNVLAALGVRRD